MWAAIGMMFVIGLIIKFWWLIAAGGVIWALSRAWTAYCADAEARLRAEDERIAALISRADQQHNWRMQGDPRGIYGADYVPLPD